MPTDPAHTVYIALGSNIGDRLGNLQAAIAALPPSVVSIVQSPVYETDPWGYTDQPAFLNQVIQAETSLPPKELLAYLKSVEKNLGRQPTFRNGPRLIDLDILLYDDLILETAELNIPHPRMGERAFVLIPLADIAPQVLHPLERRSLGELSQGVEKSGIHLWL